MSSSTRAPEGAAPGLALLRLALLAAYFLLAHAAGARGDGRLAALALGDIALIVLLQPLLARRAWAWLASLLGAVALWRLAHSPHALLPLLLVPAGVVALVGYGFGRTLVRGRTPLITRIATAMEGPLPDALRHYTRVLTAGWAALMLALALVNLLLALLAVPNGVLAGLGIASPWPVTEAQWAWSASLGNYGVLVGGLWLEFAYRQRRFPGRYRSFADFLRGMARLGPGFWAQAFR